MCNSFWYKTPKKGTITRNCRNSLRISYTRALGTMKERAANEHYCLRNFIIQYIRNVPQLKTAQIWQHKCKKALPPIDVVLRASCFLRFKWSPYKLNSEPSINAAKKDWGTKKHRKS